MLWLKGATIGLFGGLLGGMLGVGGGIIMVPLLMLLLGYPVHDAKAISLAIIMFVAVAGTVQHVRIERITPDFWPLIIGAGVLAAIGSVAGASLAEKVPRELLRRIFALLLIFAAVRMLWPTQATPETAETPEADSAVTEPSEG